MEDILRDILEKNRIYIDQGSLANYIPALARVDKTKAGLALVDQGGNLHAVGDSKTKFTIQSISKIISLFIAAREMGPDQVFEIVGNFGSADSFNSFYRLESLEKPLNPYMNMGAILTTSLIEGSGFEIFEKVLDCLRFITKNNDIDYNREVYESEKMTGDRNRGMYYLMKSYGLIEEDEGVLDNYFKQCSIEVDSEDLAKIGFFFSNNCIRFDGNNKYESRAMMKLVNSTMVQAGMYDYSAEFSRLVGIPSKSGVGGGIVSSVPNKMGIGVYSPALDEQGNSLLGINVLRDLSEKYDLSIF